MAGAASRWRCSSKKPVTQKSIISRGAWMPGREPSIRRCRFIRALRLGVTAALAATALPAAAEDPLQGYRDAPRHDAGYGAARLSPAGPRGRNPQARAPLPPRLNLTAKA